MTRTNQEVYTLDALRLELQKRTLLRNICICFHSAITLASLAFIVLSLALISQEHVKHVKEHIPLWTFFLYWTFGTCKGYLLQTC